MSKVTVEQTVRKLVPDLMVTNIEIGENNERP